jgi:hypothetical protein
MVARDGAENGVANIDVKYGARFTAEHIEIRDVEADILPCAG